MPLSEIERIDLMYCAAECEANRSYVLNEADRRLFNQNEHLLADDDVLRHGLARFLRLIEKTKYLEVQKTSHDVVVSERDEARSELERLTNDAGYAFENYRGQVDKVASDRAAKERELHDLDKKLEAAGMPRAGTRGLASAALAIAFALAIAGAMFYVLFTMWGQKPEATLEVSYNIAEMVQALLLGSGALIAGIAYAFSTLRGRNG